MKKFDSINWGLAVAAGLSAAMMFSGCRTKKPAPASGAKTDLLGSRDIIPPPYAKPFPMPQAQTAKYPTAQEKEPAGFALPDDAFIPSEGTDEPLELLPADKGQVLVAPAEQPHLPAEKQPEIIKPAPVAAVRTYTVEKGDMMGTIAKRYGISVKELQAANPGVVPERLKIGQKLVLPAGSKEKPVARPAVSTPKKADKATKMAPSKAPADGVYTVVAGDSLWVIARRYKVSSDDLRKWNGLKSDKLIVGQKLKVTGKATGSTEIKKITPAAPKPPVVDVKNTPAPEVNNQATLPAVLEAPVAKPETPVETEPVVAEPEINNEVAAQALEAQLIATNPAEPANPDNNAVRSVDHTVSIEEDTLESIATMYGSTKEMILEANPQVKSNADLVNGMTLRVPYLAN